jgi:hypothetical protein
VRNIDLPVTVFGSTPAELESRLRRLARLTQDLQGPTTFTALRSTGDLEIKLHYTGGAELEYGGEAGGREWAKLLLSFQAPNPFWQSAALQQFDVSAGDTGRGLLPKLTKLRVVSSSSFGQVDLNNVGDVQAFPVYVIYGPVDDLTISSNGLSFSFTDNLDAGDVITVDTEQGTVVDETGANRYDILGPAPKLFPIPPGLSSLVIEGENTTNDTLVIVRYGTRFEVVHG